MIEANAPIDDLDLPVGLYNALHRISITTIAELAVHTRDELAAKLPGKDYSKNCWFADQIGMKLRQNGRFLVGDTT
ncbi:MAG: DNA-directed RNA polymerase subunit alpha C-terminal domain-containing protein [Candidatus Saccharimonadales bacterium]